MHTYFPLVNTVSCICFLFLCLEPSHVSRFPQKELNPRDSGHTFNLTKYLIFSLLICDFNPLTFNKFTGVFVSGLFSFIFPVHRVISSLIYSFLPFII